MSTLKYGHIQLKYLLVQRHPKQRDPTWPLLEQHLPLSYVRHLLSRYGHGRGIELATPQLHWDQPEVVVVAQLCNFVRMSFPERLANYATLSEHFQFWTQIRLG